MMLLIGSATWGQTNQAINWNANNDNTRDRYYNMCGDKNANYNSLQTCNSCTKYYTINESDRTNQNQQWRNVGWMSFKAPDGCQVVVTLTSNGLAGSEWIYLSHGRTENNTNNYYNYWTSGSATNSTFISAMGGWITIYFDNYDGNGSSSSFSLDVRCNCVEPLCPPSDMCELTFELTDSYGDGWNGAAIQVVDVQSDSILGELTMDDGSYVSESLEVCNGREIRFIWNSGSYDYECSYTVYDVNGDVIFSGTEGSSLPLTYTPSCTVCPQPTNVTVTDITNNTATVSWNGSADSYNIRWFEFVDHANVTLTAGDVWGDGTGYQMLLDADANTYGTTIPTTGGLTTNGDASAATYAEFEYKIPTNADGALTTANIVLSNSITIQVPAGTYDWCITNPTPLDRMWIASGNGSIGGRANDFVFEAGFNYEFVVSLGANSNDRTDLTIAPIGTVHTANGVTGNSYTITGLTAGATYIVQVQSNCGGSQSNWTDPEIFTTCNLEAEIQISNE